MTSYVYFRVFVYTKSLSSGIKAKKDPYLSKEVERSSKHTWKSSPCRLEILLKMLQNFFEILSFSDWNRSKTKKGNLKA